MQINFNTLSLQCRNSKEIVDLSNQVSFFHGKVSTGKSSIAKLINFCLGGNLERTPAIKSEIISVSLELIIGNYEVLFERRLDNDSTIVATAIDSDRKSFVVSLPVVPSPKAVWADKVYSVSDFIFYLLGLNVLRVPSNKNRDDATLVRLSFKNFMWFCYLDQSKMDNSFYRQEDVTKARNSREVLKYILQYSTQKLIDLEEKYQEYKKQRSTDILTAKGLTDFLEKFGFSSENEIEALVSKTKEKIALSKKQQNDLKNGYTSDTHIVDQLRTQIRVLITEISIREESVIDLQGRMNEQETLRSELVSSKFKLAKSANVATVFQGVEFQNCPCCGTSIKNRTEDPNECILCTSPTGQDKPSLSENTDIIQNDLNDRIRELENSIDLHKKAFVKANKELTLKNNLRKGLDAELQDKLREYESIFLSNIRSIDKDVATYEERLKNYLRLRKIPQEIARLEKNAILALGKMQEITKDILFEKRNLTRGETLIEELESTFLKTLLDVGVPGVNQDDKISINRKNWEVSVWPKGEEYLSWSFYNAGSGGKKTLFNSCFLLSLHIIAAKYNLPIPSFVIIDTPMKNIDKEVNYLIFQSFYNYLYRLAAKELDKTQFVIIDNNFIPPPPDIKLSFYGRYMSESTNDNPPLIGYYTGP